MTHGYEADFSGGESNLAPGVAPSFGNLPSLPFEHTPERLVLSSDEHTRLSATRAFSQLSGEFAHDHLGRGNLSLHETESPGEVLIHADVLTLQGPAMHLEANVRGSWLSRTVDDADAAPANVQIVRELVRLAALPRQSTVRVRIEAD